MTTPDKYSPPANAAHQAATGVGRDDAGFPSGVNPNVGTSGVSTALVNIALIGDALATGAMFQVNDGWIQVCPCCLKCIDAKLFEVDHQQPWSDIRDKLKGVAEAMELDSTVFATVKSERTKEEFESSFIVTGQPAAPGLAHPKGFKVEITVACANMYSNDLKNLALVTL